jgi:hypothetical protein
LMNVNKAAKRSVRGSCRMIQGYTLIGHWEYKDCMNLLNSRRLGHGGN